MDAPAELPTPGEVDRWIDGLAEWECNRDCWGTAYLDLRESGPAAIPALARGLRHASGRVRTAVAYLLAEHGPAAEGALADLIAALADPSARVRRAAIGALVRIGEPARPAAPHLAELLKHDTDRDALILAARALEFLGSSHSTAVEPLLRLLDNRCPVVRGVAAVTAGKLAPGDDAVGLRLEEGFILDDVMRPAWAAGLARCTPERLVGLAIDHPDVFSSGDKLGDHWHHRERDRHTALHRSHRELIRPTSCAHVLLRLAALGPEAAPIRRVFVEMLATRARNAALYGLGRVGAGAVDAIPAIARRNDECSREALRAIHFAVWHEEERFAELHPTRWRERMIHRFRTRWNREPIAPADREAIEQTVGRGTRAEILRVRLAVGDVARERVGWAAQLGDVAAREGLGLPTPDDLGEIPGPDAYRAWELSLVSLPLEVRVRIGQAVGRDVLPLWRRLDPQDCIVTTSLHTLEDWIISPHRADRERFRKGIHGPDFPWGPNGLRYWWPGHGDEFRHAASAVLLAGRQLFDTSDDPRCGLWDALWAWEQYEVESPVHYFRMGPSLNALLAGRTVIPHIRRVVRAAVVPWLLGEADPVREALAPLLEP
jgi:hypothetical protein